MLRPCAERPRRGQHVVSIVSDTQATIDHVPGIETSAGPNTLQRSSSTEAMNWYLMGPTTHDTRPGELTRGQRVDT